MTHPKVIVFGPTGAVGSAAARTAHRLEASVTLAMRDTAKSIPGVPSDNAPGYTRVHADLIDPSSVSTAVRESGATHAFIYMVHSSPDHMHGTIRALKDTGVSFVVFLSSFTVSGDLHAIRPEDIIDYLHAQVELNLESIFGREHFVALRPGSFASNELQYAPSFRKGEVVRITFPRQRVDCIVPQDIGLVAGTILAKGPPEDGNRTIYLYGPHFLRPGDIVATITRVLGRKPQVKACEEADARKVLVERGNPPPLAEYFMRQSLRCTGQDGEIVGRRVNPADRENVQKYGGAKATTFEEYVRENRGEFEP